MMRVSFIQNVTTVIVIIAYVDRYAIYLCIINQLRDALSHFLLATI